KFRTPGTKVCSTGLWTRRRLMSNQNFERPGSADSNHDLRNQKMRDAAGEALTKASNTARDAAEKGKRATAEPRWTVSGHVTGILNDQLGVGAQSANRLARSLRLAADDLALESPMLASLVRGFSHNVDNYAERLEGQTCEHRKHTRVVFGVGPGARFFRLPIVKKPPLGVLPADPTDAVQPRERRPWLSNI